jgi:hypothetical protein
MSEIPSIENTVNKIQEWFDSTIYIRNLYEDIKFYKWEKEVYNYFIKVDEILFRHLCISKTYISDNTKKMIKILSFPTYEMNEVEKKKVYEELESL